MDILQTILYFLTYNIQLTVHKYSDNVITFNNIHTVLLTNSNNNFNLVSANKIILNQTECYKTLRNETGS